MADTIRTLAIMYAEASREWERGEEGGVWESYAKEAQKRLNDMGIPVSLVCLEV